MYQISQESLEEFKRLYEAEFKKPVSDDAALEMGIRLVNLYELVHKKHPSEMSEEQQS